MINVIKLTTLFSLAGMLFGLIGIYRTVYTESSNKLTVKVNKMLPSSIQLSIKSYEDNNDRNQNKVKISEI